MNVKAKRFLKNIRVILLLLIFSSIIIAVDKGSCYRRNDVSYKDMARIEYIGNGMFFMYLKKNNDLPYDERGAEHALYKSIYSLYEDRVFDEAAVSDWNEVFCIPSHVAEKKKKIKNIDTAMEKVNHSEYRYLNKPLDSVKEGDIILIEDPNIAGHDYIYFIYYNSIKSESYPLKCGKYKFGQKDSSNILGMNISELNPGDVRTW